MYPCHGVVSLHYPNFSESHLFFALQQKCGACIVGTSGKKISVEKRYVVYLCISVCPLLQVDQKLATLMSEDGSLQTSSYENRGFRKLYFNPGLFDPPCGYADPISSQKIWLKNAFSTEYN